MHLAYDYLFFLFSLTDKKIKLITDVKRHY